jgi:phosphate transport system substrate-binding protein
LRNESGTFIQPTLESISIGIAESEELKCHTNDAPSVSKGYPIAGFSYVVVYKKQAYDGRSRDRATNLAKLLWWMVHEGQSFNNGLLYGTLPAYHVVQAKALIRSMTYEGKPLADW